MKCQSRCSQADVLKAIGPPPGWTSQPFNLQLPERHDEMLCLWDRFCLDDGLKEKGETLTPALEADLVRCLHREQRKRIMRIVPVSRSHPRAQRQRFVLLGDSEGATEEQLAALVHAELNRDEHEAEEALLLLPARMGKVMGLILDDLVAITNARLIVNDTRAVPYASRWAADRLELDPRRVREALERLREHGLIVKVGELPNDHRWSDGTPLYALAVRAPCPVCAGRVEAGPSVTGLHSEDAAAAGDRQAVAQPGAEQPQVAAVAFAEGEDVVDARLAAPVGGADGGVGGSVVGHAEEGYAAYRLPFDPLAVVPF